ncbi:MAG: 30S ribosomal protein S2 [Candidatus Paceibacterota bacterium]
MEKINEPAVKKSDSLIEGMFEVGAHYGYSKSRRHPSFSACIFTTKNGNDIIDLEKTSLYLNNTLAFVKEVAEKGKTILFVGTKPEIRKTVEVAAQEMDAPFVVNRWIGGLITNFNEIKKRVKKLDELLSKRDKGELDVYTKVERMAIDAEIDDLLVNFGGVTAMNKIPDVLCVVDPRHEAIAVAEARKKNIPIIALTGSDGNLTGVEYPIPANDAHAVSTSFFLEKIITCYKENFSLPKKEEGAPPIEKEEKKV